MTEPESNAMMESIRIACQKTMFEKWYTETTQPQISPQSQKQPSTPRGDIDRAERSAQSEKVLQELIVYLAEDKSGRVDVQTAAKARYNHEIPNILASLEDVRACIVLLPDLHHGRCAFL